MRLGKTELPRGGGDGAALPGQTKVAGEEGAREGGGRGGQREEEACEDREGRDREFTGSAGGRSEMFGSVVTQLPPSGRELLRREPDFLNYLPLSVNRNTHL